MIGHTFFQSADLFLEQHGRCIISLDLTSQHKKMQFHAATTTLIMG